MARRGLLMDMYNDMRIAAQVIKKAYIDIGKHMQTGGSRLTCIDIGNFVEGRLPGRQNFIGGYLFERWFYEHGKLSTMEMALRDEERNNGIWRTATQEEMVKLELPRWAQQVISNVNSLSQKNNQQLMYISLVCEWKGLSLLGLDIMARLGVGLSGKQLNICKHDLATAERKVTDKVIKEMQPVIWMDNYSKIFGNPNYNLTTGVYADANYSVIAAMYGDLVTDMSFTYSNAGTQLIPAAHSSMFSKQAINRIVQTFMCFDNYAQVKFYDDCLSRHPEYADFIITPQHMHAHTNVYTDSPNGLKNLRTIGM